MRIPHQAPRLRGALNFARKALAGLIEDVVRVRCESRAFALSAFLIQTKTSESSSTFVPENLRSSPSQYFNPLPALLALLLTYPLRISPRYCFAYRASSPARRDVFPVESAVGELIHCLHGLLLFLVIFQLATGLVLHLEACQALFTCRAKLSDPAAALDITRATS